MSDHLLRSRKAVAPHAEGHLPMVLTVSNVLHTSVAVLFANDAARVHDEVVMVET